MKNSLPAIFLAILFSILFTGIASANIQAPSPDDFKLASSINYPSFRPTFSISERGSVAPEQFNKKSDLSKSFASEPKPLSLLLYGICGLPLAAHLLRRKKGSVAV